MYPSVYLSIHPSSYVSIYPTFYLSIYLSVYLSILSFCSIAVCVTVTLLFSMYSWIPAMVQFYLTFNLRLGFPSAQGLERPTFRRLSGKLHLPSKTTRGAFRIRMGFWGPLYHKHNKEPPKLHTQLLRPNNIGTSRFGACSAFLTTKQRFDMTGATPIKR